MITWTLQTIAIKDLIPNPKNPRMIVKEKKDKLTGLIREFGLIDKPVVNLDNMIIGGHQRVAVLKKMKEKEVECLIPDHLLLPEEIDKLCIGLNLYQGNFDYDILGDQWDLDKLIEMGFSEEQLFGIYDDSVKDFPEKGSKEKKKKECPSCGHTF